MQHRHFLVGLVSLLTLLILAPVRPLYAAPNPEDEVVLGDDLTLEEGERVDGDLVVINGDLNMQSGSRVDGSITVLRGGVEIDGAVAGDVVALLGDVNLEAGARVDGDVIALGGRVQKAEGAQTGNVVEGVGWQGLRPSLFGLRDWDIWTVLTMLMGALIMAGLGLAIVTFWPTQTAQVAETIATAPLPSLGVGCLLYPLAGSLAVFILVTICLAPFVPVVVLLVVAASLLGWVALGMLGGRWLARGMGWRRATPLAVAGVGVFALSITAAIIGAVPCLGSMAVLATASVGLGAVALSRFGTSPYRGRPTEPSVEAR
jgi:cytoskeletal protein CcmA (bactofilin family)